MIFGRNIITEMVQLVRLAWLFKQKVAPYVVGPQLSRGSIVPIRGEYDFPKAIDSLGHEAS